MNPNYFLEKISKDFENIKNKFKEKIHRLGLNFDDDVFSETMLKCNSTINREYSHNELINYFWKSFKNNTLRELYYSRNKNSHDISSITEDIEDEPYNEGDYDEVSRMIIRKFGTDMYELFSLHANGTSYSDLIKFTNIKDLKYKFRTIREYIRNNYKRE